VPFYITLGSEGKAALGGGLGAAVGAAQTVITQNADATGQTGKAPLPQIGGFGTWGAIIDEVTGAITLVTGVAGAMKKGPTKNHSAASAALIGHGAAAIGGRVLAVVLDTAAVKVPGALAKGAAAQRPNPGLAGARAGAGLQRTGSQALYSGGVAPRGATPGVGATSYSAARFQ
jgi:hypothetical protein